MKRICTVIPLLLAALLLVGCSGSTSNGLPQQSELIPEMEEKAVSLTEALASVTEETESEEPSVQAKTGPGSESVLPEPTEKEKTADLSQSQPAETSPEGEKESAVLIDADYYGQSLWMLTTEGIVRMNLETETGSLFASRKAKRLAVTPYGIFLLKTDSLEMLDFDGKTVREIPLALPTSENCTFPAFDVSGKNAVFALREPDSMEDVLISLELGSGKIREILFEWNDLGPHRTVQAITYGEDDTFFFTVAPAESPYDAAGRYRLYSLNADSSKVEELGLFQMETVLDTAYDSANRCLYLIGTRSGEILTYSLKSGEEQTVCLFEPQTTVTAGFEHPASFSRIFYTGSNFVLWSGMDETVQIVKANAELAVLTVLCSESMAERNNLKSLIQSYPGKTAAIRLTTYPDSEYDDRLRTKLLAKEQDFDVYLLTLGNEDAWLWDVLRNGAFEPLDGYACFAEARENMFGSVRNMMTDNQGRTFGIPLSFMNRYSVAGCTDEFQRSGLDIPEQGWTADDFFELCETVKDQKIEGLSVCSVSFLNTLVLTAVQKSLYDGAPDEALLLSLFERIGQYAQAGLFNDETAEETHCLLRTASLIPNRVKDTSAGIAEYRNFPTVDGMTVEYLMTCAIINPNSLHKEEAASLLAFVISPENVYGQESQFANPLADCWLYPDYSRYQNIDIPELYPISDRQKEMFDRLDDIPVNPRALTVYPSAVGSREAIENILSGKQTARDAAEEVIRNVKYRYFE